MADKNLQISLRVKLAGVKEVEDRLRQLQQKLNTINKTFFEKKSGIEDAKFKVKFDKIKTAEIDNLKVNKLHILSSNAKEATLKTQTPTISYGSDTSEVQAQIGQGFDWKTAIQFSKMKALTPAALMQMASRMMTLTAAFSGFIAALGGIGARVAFTTVTKYTRTVSSAMGELKNVILSLTGMDKMFSVQGITNSMIALADVTKEIQKQSLQTGIAVDALSQYRFAMKQVGVSAENFGSNISYMGKAIVQAATGASIDAGNAFKRLKLDPKELRLKDTQTQFEEIAKAIAQLPSETDKASAALLIFNRSGSQLLPFINKFSEGLKQSEGVLGQLPRLMKLYSSEFTQFSNNISNLQIKGQQYISGFMTQMVPSLNSYLQRILNIDFTDFGRMFANNFQRTVSSLNLKDLNSGESWKPILNSLVLDLMDVVDKALVKTTGYIGDALIALDWDAIAKKILVGTFHFGEELVFTAWRVVKDAVTGEGTQREMELTRESEDKYKSFLSQNGVQNTDKQTEIIEKIYEGLKENRFAIRTPDQTALFANNENTVAILQEHFGKGFDKELFYSLSQTLNENLAKNLPGENPEVLRILKLISLNTAEMSKDDKEKYENLKKEVLFDNSLSNLNNQQILHLNGLYSRYGNDVDFNELIKELRKTVVTQNPNADSLMVRGTFEELSRNYTKIEELFEKYEKEVGKENSDKFRDQLLKYSDGKEFFNEAFQRELIERLSDALEKATKGVAKERADASAELTQSASLLKKSLEHYKQLETDTARIHSERQRTNTNTPQEKLQENTEYAKKRLNIALAKELSLKEAQAVLNATKILSTDEEWINLNKQVQESLKSIRNEIKQLQVDAQITDEEFLIKKFAVEAENAERNIRSLKGALDSLKSNKTLTVENIQSIGAGYQRYFSALNDKKSSLIAQKDEMTAKGFNPDMIDKIAREIEDVNNTIQQVSNEAEQWAQSVIVEGVQETVTQRNTELGQFEFEQLPEWAATNKQRYDYQMQVFDAQIQASEDNIEAIRKAQEQMLELDPAVQAVRKAMNELSRDTEDYDEKFAGLLNDLEQARSNSNVRRSAGYRQLEQMRGQEQTKGMMAQSRKQKQENPESFGHQMSKSISNASDQMGTLQENVGQGFGNMIMSVRDSLSTLVSDLLSGTMTIGQAFQKMGQMILQSLISTFGQIVANFVMQQTVMRLLQLMFNAELAAQAAALTTMWTTPATLASIASWGGAAAIGSSAVISALALTKSATAGMSAMAKGGRIKGKEQIIRVNEEGEEFIVSAKSPLANEKYLKLANLGYNLDSLFANQSMKEVNASASKLNIINNSKTERPQTNNNINIGMINSRQDKRRWMRKEGQRMIVDFLNGHRGALKYA